MSILGVARRICALGNKMSLPTSLMRERTIRSLSFGHAKLCSVASSDPNESSGCRVYWYRIMAAAIFENNSFPDFAGEQDIFHLLYDPTLSILPQHNYYEALSCLAY